MGESPICNVQGHAQAEMHPPASMPKHHVSSSRPATAREAAMDLIDLANLKVFGNRHFRPQQREVIKAALQVTQTVLNRTQQACAQAALTDKIQHQAVGSIMIQHLQAHTL